MEGQAVNILDPLFIQLLTLAITGMGGIILILWKNNSDTRAAARVEAGVAESAALAVESKARTDALIRVENQGKQTIARLDIMGEWINETKTALAVKETICKDHGDKLHVLSEDMGVLKKELGTYHRRLNGEKIENYRNNKEAKS